MSGERTGCWYCATNNMRPIRLLGHDRVTMSRCSDCCATNSTRVWDKCSTATKDKGKRVRKVWKKGIKKRWSMEHCLSVWPPLLLFRSKQKKPKRRGTPSSFFLLSLICIILLTPPSLDIDTEKKKAAAPHHHQFWRIQLISHSYLDASSIPSNINRHNTYRRKTPMNATPWRVWPSHTCRLGITPRSKECLFLSHSSPTQEE